MRGLLTVAGSLWLAMLLLKLLAPPLRRPHCATAAAAALLLSLMLRCSHCRCRYCHHSPRLCCRDAGAHRKQISCALHRHRSYLETPSIEARQQRHVRCGNNSHTVSANMSSFMINTGTAAATAASPRHATAAVHKAILVVLDFVALVLLAVVVLLLLFSCCCCCVSTS